jgi:hypothetical protein
MTPTKASLPQQVTTRYVNSLIRRGNNGIFDIVKILLQESTYDGITIGHYYVATVICPSYGVGAETAAGVTPEQAVRRALAKHGVTFR